MKEIPILYSTPMIQAKLAGRKTQTRRLVKLEKEFASDAKLTWGYTCFTPERHISIRGKHANGDYGESFIKCPYGKPGDLLWARETIYQEGELGLKYVADNEHIEEEKIPTDHKPYRNYAFCNVPSIHMPKYLSRIWDRVVSVRVERLQDISEEDARAEGVEKHWYNDHGETPGRDLYFVTGVTKEGFGYSSAVEAYKDLWININGPDSWEKNEWVWVITTETLSTTGRP